MLVLFHIVIALVSMGYSAFVFFAPSQSRLRLTYVFVAITLFSGISLVFLKPVHMVSACLTGAVYLGGVIFCIVSARHKLAKETR